MWPTPQNMLELWSPADGTHYQKAFGILEGEA
jgi:hypothetical protein